MKRSNNNFWPWAEMEKPAPRDETAVAFARAFATPDGRKVLAHLKSITLERVLGPATDLQQLYYQEGQRALTHFITTMITRGRQ